MDDVKLWLQRWWWVVGECAVHVNVVSKEFYGGRMVQVVSDIIDEGVEKKWAEDTTLRYATGDKARIWKCGVYFDKLGAAR